MADTTIGRATAPQGLRLPDRVSLGRGPLGLPSPQRAVAGRPALVLRS